MRAKRPFVSVAVAFGTLTAATTWAQNDTGSPQADRKPDAAPSAAPKEPAPPPSVTIIGARDALGVL
jgi:hypothetical protein